MKGLGSGGNAPLVRLQVDFMTLDLQASDPDAALYLVIS